ncbi:MAG: CDP-alcohol phosphatidyltransferase family protein [Acidobacteria bacterium]|nr:CDP-alcohol phosphatidyltransferase family protein [Acidobacteriota bacterium]MBI3655260.1 CDP-alcohol phosphatidyltransferase family protein [Acidobacteriota bacterium]
MVTFTERIGRSVGFILDKIVWVVTLIGVSPNTLTLIGLVINVIAAYLLANGRFFEAGLVVIGAGLFDMIDGRVARAMNSDTKFGAFFDSVIDRFSDVVLFIGLIVHYARTSQISYVLITCIVLMGAVMTSYARARAESIIPKCKIGFTERPERIVLLIVGALFNRMAAVLWLMAILSNWTVIDRIIYTWKETKAMEQRNRSQSA